MLDTASNRILCTRPPGGLGLSQFDPDGTDAFSDSTPDRPCTRCVQLFGQTTTVEPLRVSPPETVAYLFELTRSKIIN